MARQAKTARPTVQAIRKARAERAARAGKYLPILQVLDLMDPHHRTICRHIMQTFAKDFAHGPGSRAIHQWWEGGYQAHIAEVLNIGLQLYLAMTRLRPGALPFSLSSLLFCLFCHDLDKLGKYVWTDGRWEVKPGRDAKEDKYAVRDRILGQFGFVPTEDELNALNYVEGEGKDYSPTVPRSGPLASFCHAVDSLSARAFRAHPRPDDSWKGSEAYAERQ